MRLGLSALKEPVAVVDDDVAASAAAALIAAGAAAGTAVGADSTVALERADLSPERAARAAAGGRLEASRHVGLNQCHLMAL